MDGYEVVVEQRFHHVLWIQSEMLVWMGLVMVGFGLLEIDLLWWGRGRLLIGLGGELVVLLVGYWWVDLGGGGWMWMMLLSKVVCSSISSLTRSHLE